jgi:hypothetical protein
VNLAQEDFEAAQADFVPLSLRDVKLQKSEVAWADIGGPYKFIPPSKIFRLSVNCLPHHRIVRSEADFTGDLGMAHKIFSHLCASTIAAAIWVCITDSPQL